MGAILSTPWRMETSSEIASWLSFAATAIGLGGLISQISIINDKLDPFHANRSPNYLGFWYDRQDRRSWWQSLVKTTLPPGKAGWAVILAIFHAEDLSPVRPISSSSSDEVEKGLFSHIATGLSSRSADSVPSEYTEWKSLEKIPLVLHQRHACVPISRASLITIMILTNTRPVFSYSDASGHRSAYASYNGQWYLNWSIGQDAVVHFAPHDSHSAATDVYPRTFPQRIDACIHMLVAGVYKLEHTAKGFPGAHGARHLYNMLGGRVYDIDFMTARKQLSQEEPLATDTITLALPSRDNPLETVTMLVPSNEQAIIAHVLDCLPWNHLSWSMHRGFRDILLAYSKPIMDSHRSILADLCRSTVASNPEALIAQGWRPHFVRSSMGDMAASAILAGKGDSGDLVRVVTAIVRVIADGWSVEELDCVDFWRRQGAVKSVPERLDVASAVALTKVFVVEWSQEFDYQMYHDLPTSLYFA
ncbi:hypothetical protein TI39_contig68g00001 [Zymoseptoria brevis]|uniref:Uncharacterized protein n=1 Tax=Zymoseptoria brevis TaxID=1047168 RepID=A0A0F4GZ28_9PEZI|nr:hypothetical protein TI39_contig68g00001 [Zymoseptoria brevis]